MQAPGPRAETCDGWMAPRLSTGVPAWVATVVMCGLVLRRWASLFPCLCSLTEDTAGLNLLLAVFLPTRYPVGSLVVAPCHCLVQVVDARLESWSNEIAEAAKSQRGLEIVL